MNLIQNGWTFLTSPEKCLYTTLWNVIAYCAHATVELLQKETPEFIPPQLWPPNSLDLNPVDNIMWELLQEKVYKARLTALELSTMLLTNGFRNDDIAQL